MKPQNNATRYRDFQTLEDIEKEIQSELLRKNMAKLVLFLFLIRIREPQQSFKKNNGTKNNEWNRI